MLPKSPQSNYSQRPVRRVRLPKIGPTKTKGLFQEYFYACLVIIFIVVAVLGRAGGLSGHDALVVGGWVTGFIWFGRQVKGYFAEKSKPVKEQYLSPPAQAPVEAAKGSLPLPPNMKPMIGPQWPLRAKPGTARPVPWPEPAQASQPDNAADHKNKSGFIYQRPTLPDRKPKLPNNWPGQKDKKPKR